jgi:tRNA/rRNA methyltransferase/tRNA (cytidine32/uridine32-2'-O)-methyltransferase
MRLDEVVVVLARPGEAGNVGAVCRAMKNMGLSRLRLAGAGPLDEGAIRARAVHAVDVWEGAEMFPGIAGAAADCTLVVGITRRRGQRRKGLSLDPAELAALLREKAGRAALVFGNERAGLDAGELALCGLASHIPSDGAFPSLNLSHAVQIYAYELYRALAPEAALEAEGHWIPLERREVDALVRSVTDSLASLGFYKQPGREDQERFFRDIFSRAGLTGREGKYLGEIFAKAARLGNRPKSSIP